MIAPAANATPYYLPSAVPLQIFHRSPQDWWMDTRTSPVLATTRTWLPPAERSGAGQKQAEESRKNHLNSTRIRFPKLPRT